MARESSTTTYELYFLEVRGWELSAKFPENERYIAMRHAKKAEAEGQAAKIIREIHFDRRNINEDTVAYISGNVQEVQNALEIAEKKSHVKKAPPVSRFASASVNYPSRASVPDSEPPPPKKSLAVKNQEDTDFVMRIAIVALGSTTMAGLTAGLASALLDHLAASGSGPAGGHAAMLYVIFLVAFVVSAIPLILTFTPLDGTRPKWMSATPTNPVDKTGKAIKKLKKGPLAVPLFIDEPGSDSGPELEPALVPGPELVPEPASEPAPEFASEPASESIAWPNVDLKQGEKIPDEVKMFLNVDGPGVENIGVTSSGMERNRVAMMHFLGGAVSALKGSRPQLDPFNKFGVHLIIAGASSALGELHGLDIETRLRLTQEGLEILGTKGSLAKAFCDKLEEYSQNPRYLDMMQAGREAMNKVLAGNDAPYAELPKVMKLWNAPAAQTASQTIVTVMFTDMVGSTTITQARGDERAQILVRTHNTIVRAALSDFGGREVKHTGDGIMASFVSAASAVEATIAIQRETNAQSKDLDLHLRIGLNAGEPIREEDDLFGTTVQLAARICAKAETDQILVSLVVRELCAGKPIRFIPRGTFELKGVTDQQPLYEVEWSVDAAPILETPIPEEKVLKAKAPVRRSADPPPSASSLVASQPASQPGPQPKAPSNPFKRHN